MIASRFFAVKKFRCRGTSRKLHRGPARFASKQALLGTSQMKVPPGPSMSIAALAAACGSSVCSSTCDITTASKVPRRASSSSGRSSAVPAWTVQPVSEATARASSSGSTPTTS